MVKSCLNIPKVSNSARKNTFMEDISNDHIKF